MRKFLLPIVILFAGMAISNAQKFANMAPTPPMGWNSWNFYNCNINEEKVKRIADAMASNGMKEAGYQYVVIDDCWQIARDKDGYIIADPKKFPSGIKAPIPNPNVLCRKNQKFGSQHPPLCSFGRFCRR